jgi:hypothetical protein
MTLRINGVYKAKSGAGEAILLHIDGEILTMACVNTRGARRFYITTTELSKCYVEVL